MAVLGPFQRLPGPPGFIIAGIQFQRSAIGLRRHVPTTSRAAACPTKVIRVDAIHPSVPSPWANVSRAREGLRC